MQNEDIFRTFLKQSKYTVFFGGAGVSTGSGMPGSSTGIFNKKLNKNILPEELVSRTFFDNYPREFFDFYRENLIHLDARPNDCHKALAKLERQGKLQAVITQNIDGLHQMAGSNHVLELHGSIRRNRCINCRRPYDVEVIIKCEGIPRCTECGAIIKPDIVLYEEELNEEVFMAAEKEIEAADMLIVGGTSLAAYPAAALLHYFRGRYLVLINHTEMPSDKNADLIIRDSLGEFFRETILEKGLKE